MSVDYLNKLKNKDGFQEIDLQFGKFILKEADSEDHILYLTAALASQILRNGDVCCDLNILADTEFPKYKSGIELNRTDLPTIKLPNLKVWLDVLSKYPKIISEDKYTPLILDSSNRLYLHRYWNYENRLAENILQRCSTDFSFIKKLKNNQITSVSQYFNSQSNDEIDWQQIAVFSALANNLTIITGGPGTGKTSTVAAILTIMLDIDPNLKIKVCTPTGKAGSRLIESINDELNHLNPINSLLTLEKLKQLEAYTIHRLLGAIPLSPHFKHNKSNPVSANVIIIDEASMLPQTLLSKLLDAIPFNTKLILLGDRNQLASVEAGAVMANLCDAFKPNIFSQDFTDKIRQYFRHENWLFDIKNNNKSNITIELHKSHRFDDTKGIGLLSKALQNNSDHVSLITRLNSNELNVKPHPKIKYFNESLINYLSNVKIILNHNEYKFTDYLKAKTPEFAYKIFNEFKVLCSHNIGLSGTENINRIIHSYLFDTSFEKLPIGTPIMIEKNNEQLNLYNGDVGLIWTDVKGNKKAFFPNIKSQKFKPYPISLLPEYKEVFAMTVHKSQGSGFQNVLIIFPEIFSPILTKELLYTAITRAKKKCTVWANDNIFKSSIENITKRNSGLKEKLSAEQS